MISLMHSVYERARTIYWLRCVILSNHLFNIAHFVKKMQAMFYLNQPIMVTPGWIIFFQFDSTVKLNILHRENKDYFYALYLCQ